LRLGNQVKIAIFIVKKGYAEFLQSKNVGEGIRMYWIKNKDKNTMKAVDVHQI
jgi:hypothetical protein